MLRGLTIPPAVRGQQGGPLTGSSHRPFPPAAPSGADRLYGGGKQAVKPWPILPKKDGNWQIFHYPHFHRPSAGGSRDGHSRGRYVSRVSVHTNDQGEALVSPWGVKTSDCTRLTALPESNRARNGWPLIFMSTSGAPVCRSRCTIQPANHVRMGGVRTSVGMGSSLGVGAAGLPTGCRVPSGERRSQSM